jgi:simple sugar transport system permease protein
MELKSDTSPAEGAAHAGPQVGQRVLWAMRARLRELTLIPVLVVTFVIGTFVNDAFLTRTNIIDNILQSSAVLAVVVIAESLILIAGKFDLSLESIVGLAPMVAAWLMTPTSLGGSGSHVSPYLTLPLALAVGAAVGLVNGFFVVRLRLNAFIVTLAMLILLRGVTLGLTNGQTLVELPGPFLWIGSATILNVPVAVWIAGVLFVAVGLFLRYHSTGRAIYAIGGNSEAARASGIRVERMTWGLYVVGGLLAALAGIMLTGRIAAVTAGQGQNLIFSVFAAAVIGGVSLNGGIGSMLGAFTGVLLLGTISNILTLSQIASFWIDASFGAIILAALLLSRFTTGVREE